MAGLVRFHLKVRLDNGFGQISAPYRVTVPAVKLSLDSIGLTGSREILRPNARPNYYC